MSLKTIKIDCSLKILFNMSFDISKQYSDTSVVPCHMSGAFNTKEKVKENTEKIIKIQEKSYNCVFLQFRDLHIKFDIIEKMYLIINQASMNQIH